MTDDVVIRQERPEDHAAVREVVAAAFGSEVEPQLVEDIRGSAEYIPELALVAERDGTIVGHVMISYAWLDNGVDRRQIATLSPLAVAPDAQRAGVGSALVRAVTAAAEQQGESLVVLEGSPAYYGRLGFEPASRSGIEMTLPSWAPPEAAQVMKLRDYDPAWRGQVVYPTAFDVAAEQDR